jgi:hypothetical protein
MENFPKHIVVVEYYSQELRTAEIEITDEQLTILKETNVLSSNDKDENEIMKLLREKNTIKEEHRFYEVQNINNYLSLY